MKEALFYEQCETYALCTLCPHRCHIEPGRSGLCGVRANAQGRLYAASYGRLTSLSPVEISSVGFARFLPRTRTLAVASYGCNLACPFCNQSDIAKGSPGFACAQPDEIASLASRRGVPSLTFTGNEPAVAPEFLMDVSAEARKKGVAIAAVTAGFLSPEPAARLVKCVSALSVDVKAWDAEACARLGADLQTIRSVIEYAQSRVHLEVTLLLTPGCSCDLQQVADLSRFLCSLRPDIPLHLSRYYPAYNFLKPATDPAFMQAAADVANKYLRYVYLSS